MYRDSEMAIWFASGVGARRASCAPVLRTSWPVLLVVGVLALFVWPWGNRSSSRPARPLRAALRPVARRARRSSRPRATAAACSSSSATSADAANGAQRLRRSPRDGTSESVTSARSGRLENDRRRALAGARARPAQRARPRERRARRWRASRRYRVLAGERAVQRADRAAAASALPTLDLLREPTAAQPGRAGLAPRAAVRRAPTCCCSASACRPTNPRRASNWNLLFALLGFVVYYNLINLSQAWVASGQARRSAPALLRAARRRASCSRWRCSGGATTARCALRRAARAAMRPRRMRTVRRLLYRDIVGAVGLRRAGLPVAVLLHRLRRRARRRRQARLHALGTRRCYVRCCELPGHFYELFADRGADRHHLRAGAPGAVVGVHHPAHRRPRARARARAAGAARRWSSARSPSWSATTSRRVASARRVRCAPRSAAGCELGRAGAWLKDRAQRARRASAAYSVNVRRTAAGRRAARACASSSSTPTAGCVARIGAAQRHGRRDGSLARCRTSSVTALADAAGADGRRAVASSAPQLTLAEHAHADVVAAAVLPVSDDVDARAVALQQPPGGQEQAAQRHADPVLEEGAVSVRLPGDGGAGAAVRLPARARAAASASRSSAASCSASASCC